MSLVSIRTDASFYAGALEHRTGGKDKRTGWYTNRATAIAVAGDYEFHEGYRFVYLIRCRLKTGPVVNMQAPSFEPKEPRP